VESLIDFRRRLHAHPELAHAEHETAHAVVEFLAKLEPDRIQTGVGGTGVIATFESGVDGPTMLFRSELDALPIEERNVVGHRSTIAGVSHKCGHDGHTTILVGLAERLAAEPPATGRVHLLFQPAEETGTGAASVLSDPAFDHIQPDFGVAIHNMPGFELHTVVVKPGSMYAAVRSVVIRYTGRTAHAAEPDKGENPSLAIADLLRECDQLTDSEVTSPTFAVITPVHVLVGSPAYGVSAGAGEVHLTIRSIDSVGLDALFDTITASARRYAERDRLQFDLEIVEDFRANMNDPAVTQLVRAAAEDCGLTVTVPDVGLPHGEDFGLFGEHFPCCMLLLGAGVSHDPVHNPDYDFPDELIATGVDLLERIVRRQTQPWH
jgi:amidohydrolase